MRHLSYLFVFSLIVCVYSCTSEKDTVDETNQENTQKLQFSDICGVWVDNNNDLYYIAIYPSGKYSYCFNNKMIGSGVCTLNDNILCLNDEYTNASDNISIQYLNSTLTLSGDITKFNLISEHIYKQFIKSSESLSPSVVGKKKTATGGLNMYYDNLRQEISFTSNIIFEFNYTGTSRSTGQYKTISHYTWRYVYRKPYTYGIKINDNNNIVEIYDFPFLYMPNWDALELRIDSFKVQ